jgi:hypothetical protein
MLGGTSGRWSRASSPRPGPPSNHPYRNTVARFGADVFNFCIATGSYTGWSRTWHHCFSPVPQHGFKPPPASGGMCKASARRGRKSSRSIVRFVARCTTCPSAKLISRTPCETLATSWSASKQQGASRARISHLHDRSQPTLYRCRDHRVRRRSRSHPSSAEGRKRPRYRALEARSPHREISRTVTET